MSDHRAPTSTAANSESPDSTIEMGDNKVSALVEKNDDGDLSTEIAAGNTPAGMEDEPCELKGLCSVSEQNAVSSPETLERPGTLPQTNREADRRVITDSDVDAQLHAKNPEAPFPPKRKAQSFIRGPDLLFAHGFLKGCPEKYRVTRSMALSQTNPKPEHSKSKGDFSVLYQRFATAIEVTIYGDDAVELTAAQKTECRRIASNVVHTEIGWGNLEYLRPKDYKPDFSKIIAYRQACERPNPFTKTYIQNLPYDAYWYNKYDPKHGLDSFQLHSNGGQAGCYADGHYPYNSEVSIRARLHAGKGYPGNPNAPAESWLLIDGNEKLDRLRTMARISVSLSRKEADIAEEDRALYDAIKRDEETLSV